MSNMAEPTSSAAAGFAGWKLIGGVTGVGIAAGLAAIVVMCMQPPRHAREWVVGIISTIMGSIGGGAALVQYLGLQGWMQSPSGTVALLGLVFACGLPAWAVVRWVFTFIERRSNKDIGEVIADVKEVVVGPGPKA